MLLYETLILSNTHITKDELEMLENYFDTLTSNFKGKVKSFDRWGKYHLAYPIKKNDYGFYALSRYEIPEGEGSKFFKELDTFFKIKCNDIVLRNVTIKLDPKTTPVEYKRPEPVDSRSNNLDTFLKKNKMEGILNSDISKKNEQKKSTENVASKNVVVDETNKN